MSVLITLTAGAGTGPFKLYSNSDSFATPFITGISRAALVAGYTATVPYGTTIVRVISTGACTTQVDIPVSGTPPTTTTSTTIPSTTSTTTGIPVSCYVWFGTAISSGFFFFTPCGTSKLLKYQYIGGDTISLCSSYVTGIDQNDFEGSGLVNTGDPC